MSPLTVPKFVTPLEIPGEMPFVSPDVYRIAVVQMEQQILPNNDIYDFPCTTVWSYVADQDWEGTAHYPAFTIKAKKGVPTQITWINRLVDDDGNFLPHLLPIDQTLHWANPPGGITGRDSRPSWDDTPGSYQGPVPIVTHVHGMTGVDDWSDGYSEAWYLPIANDLPEDYATVGSWYDVFKQKAYDATNIVWEEGTATFVYHNQQRPSTLFYHDHTLGITRVNVYAGPVGFYLIDSNDPADQAKVLNTNKVAVLPSEQYEIPLAIQDRSFNTDGSLFFPDSRTFFGDYDGDVFVPYNDIPPIWNPEFFGNFIVVNGRTWPQYCVEPRRYRFRLLNGCDSRTLLLEFDTPKVDVWQIGTEGGFLRAPISRKQILLAPAERADIIVDFSKIKPGKRVILLNKGPDSPFGGLPVGSDVADPHSTGLVMAFDIIDNVTLDLTTPPNKLVLPQIPIPGAVTKVRSLGLYEIMSEQFLIPISAKIGLFDPITGEQTPLNWDDPVTEDPIVNVPEIWDIYNFTADAHPMHIHEIQFQLIGRQKLNPDNNTPIGVIRGPDAGEDGYKDTIISYPGEVTKVVVKFSKEGRYVWHCHILSHEDNEFMRPINVLGIETKKIALKAIKLKK